MKDDKNYTKQTNFRGLMMLNEPMKKHTSWHIGGQAKCFFKPADVEDLRDFLKCVPKDESLICMGLGSNLLVRDGGFNGTIVALTNGFNNVHVYDQVKLHVGAGVACAKVAKMSVAAGLTGAEFLAGIPGTMGGALAMNAGVSGSETWDIVESVTMFDREGQSMQIKAADFDVGYRTVNFSKNSWFISAELALIHDVEKKGLENIRALLKQRYVSQPTGLASCGSVFINPGAFYAAKLIEESGLKGKVVGDAVVSEKHANFIINAGDASATDAEKLIQLMQKTVQQNTGVELVREVVIIGDRESQW